MVEPPSLLAEKQALILALFGIAYGLAVLAVDLGVNIAINNTYHGTVTQARATAYCVSFTLGLWASMRVMWTITKGLTKALILPALFFHLLLMVGMVWEIFRHMD